QVDPASPGFPSNVVALSGGAKYFPLVDVGGNAATTCCSQLGDNLAGNTEHSIYSFQPTVTKIAGAHSIRAGYDARVYREFGANANRLGGEYQFRSNFTRQQDNSSAAFGQDFAGFLLGLPSGGSIDRSAERLNYSVYHGVYVQDDWKVTNKLTVN